MKITIASLLASLALAVPAAAETNQAGARVLLVTGIDYPGHRWRETTPVLVEALTNKARLRVDVLEDPYRLDATDLSPYRAVFLHFMNWEKPDPNDRAKENLRSFVERGGGLVMIHFACGAFQDWPEFRNLAGRIYDRTNTHDPRGPFTIEVANTNHAITRGMTSFGVDDELYICLAGEKPIDVLAAAESKITKRHHPMAFVHSYGKGRVFQTPLGHDVKALRSGRTLELIRRGTLWAARLEDDSRAKANRADVERAFKLPPNFSAEKSMPEHAPPTATRQQALVAMKTGTTPPFLTRRRFLQANATAGFAAPLILRSSLRAASPNGKLNHACIGVGGMRGVDLQNFENHPRTQIVALCDVDANHLKRAAAKQRHWQLRSRRFRHVSSLCALCVLCG